MLVLVVIRLLRYKSLILVSKIKIYPGWYHELHFELPEAAQEVLLTYENWIVDRILSKKHKDGSQQSLKQENKQEKSTENVEQKQEPANVQTEVSHEEKKEEVKEADIVETKQEGN